MPVQFGCARWLLSPIHLPHLTKFPPHLPFARCPRTASPVCASFFHQPLLLPLLLESPMAAAAVLDSLAIPCPRRGAASASAFSRDSFRSPLPRRGIRVVPRFSGLRCASPAPRVNAAPSGVIRGRANIVCEAPKTVTSLPEVSAPTWQSLVLDSDVPVLVDFWAPWCGPCRMIEPTVVKLAKIYEGKLKCYKLNTDESPDLATQYGIRSIPTMIIFKSGEKKETVIGAVPETTLVASIEKFI